LESFQKAAILLGHVSHDATFGRDAFAGAGLCHPDGAGFAGHEDVRTTQIYTHVMQKPEIGARSPLDN